MKRLERMNILMVGNNPAELSVVDQTISRFGRGLLKTTFLFDLGMITQSIKKLNPAGIFIDDKLNIKDIKKTIFRLHRNKNTAHIPVTIVKSSNYANYPNLGADDFILHTNLSGKSMYKSVLNGKRFRKSRIYFIKAYRRQQHKLLQIKEQLETLFYGV